MGREGGKVELKREGPKGVQGQAGPEKRTRKMSSRRGPRGAAYHEEISPWLYAGIQVYSVML